MEQKKILIVIDMQNDFITGSLANDDAKALIPAIAERIEAAGAAGNPVFFTRDTHTEDYLNTQEGRLLPIPHCLKGTDGWQITDELKGYAAEEDVLDKYSFGCLDLPGWLRAKLGAEPAEIEVCGICTDICVISNIMILKAAFPEVPVKVRAELCAGITPEGHETALNAMKACQVIVE